MEEKWMPIPNYEGVYEVSNLGRVKSLDRTIYNMGGHGSMQKIKGRILVSCRAKNGYMVVNLFKKTSYIHRIVCSAFIGEIPYKMTINHKNGNKQDNNIENLEVVSYSENIKHSFNILGRISVNAGKTNTNVSKPVSLIDSYGKIIREFPSAREASRLTGVNHKSISACCTGKRKTINGYIWKFQQLV